MQDSKFKSGVGLTETKYNVTQHIIFLIKLFKSLEYVLSSS